MTREELANASECLEDAADSCGDDEARGRLNELADQLDHLADADRGPDHGRLARLQTALNEVREDADDETVAAIEDAKDLISSYRETVEGV